MEQGKQAYREEVMKIAKACELAGMPEKLGNFIEQGNIIFSLSATFDEDDRDPETNSLPQSYFIPDSCVQCHGGSTRRLKLNYLDTDHWLDRVFPDYVATAKTVWAFV